MGKLKEFFIQAAFGVVFLVAIFFLCLLTGTAYLEFDYKWAGKTRTFKMGESILEDKKVY